MSAKGSLLKSLVKLLELVLPERAQMEGSADEESLDPPMQLAVRVVMTWAQVNHVPLPRAWAVFSAQRCPASRHIRSEIHWAIKTLFIQIRKDHGQLLEDKYRFKLELAVATANRAWFLIEEKDEDEEVDSTPVVDAYAGMFDPTLSEPA
jgi:hypothetical protein